MPTLDPHRVALVTGGTGALGREVVRAFAAAGLDVHVPRRSRDREEELRSFLAERPEDEVVDRVRFHACDVTQPGDVDDLVRAVVEEHGRLDVLVNGVGGFTMGSLEETGPGTWRRMIDINATSAFLCARAVGGPMKERGWGRILNVASMPALEGGEARMSAYAAAKAALVNLTGSLSKELRGDGITVNAVAPSIIDTPANRAAMPDADRSSWLTPAEITRVLAFLASDDAAVVTGATIPLARS